jgi:hypothetical protein
MRDILVAALAVLAAAVAPGGWLYAGFANSAFPPFRGGVRAGPARRTLERGGLRVAARYLALPDQRIAALLVPAEQGAHLGYVLRHLVFPYTRADSALAGRCQRAVLALARVVALGTPHPVRVALAPAYALVARRDGTAAPALPAGAVRERTLP